MNVMKYVISPMSCIIRVNLCIHTRKCYLISRITQAVPVTRKGGVSKVPMAHNGLNGRHYRGPMQCGWGTMR